jgi:hypothetical protein
VEFALDNDERRDGLTVRTNALYHSNPFPIAWLDLPCLRTTVGTGYDHGGRDLAHQKPGLVKVPNIFLMDTVFGDHVPYESKPVTNYSWIFALGPLVVVRTRKTRLELWMSLNEALNPTRPDTRRVAYCQQSVGHIFHVADPGSESSQI